MTPKKKGNRNQVPLNMYVSPDLKEKFRVICKLEGRKYNEQFRRILEEWLETKARLSGKKIARDGVPWPYDIPLPDFGEEHRKHG